MEFNFTFIIIIFIIGLVTGGIVGFFVNSIVESKEIKEIMSNMNNHENNIE